MKFNNKKKINKNFKNINKYFQFFFYKLFINKFYILI